MAVTPGGGAPTPPPPPGGGGQAGFGAGGAGGGFGGGAGGGPGQRLSTETRRAFQTTEFIAYVAVLIGVLIAGLVIGGDDEEDFFRADEVWLYAVLLTIGYMLSRGWAKSGVRERYWDKRDDE